MVVQLSGAGGYSSQQPLSIDDLLRANGSGSNAAAAIQHYINSGQQNLLGPDVMPWFQSLGNQQAYIDNQTASAGAPQVTPTVGPVSPSYSPDTVASLNQARESAVSSGQNPYGGHLASYGSYSAANPSPGSSAGLASASGGPDLSKLPPEFQGLYDSIKGALDKLRASGQVLNPNVQITPDVLNQFLTQAQTEINPYYSTQLSLAKNALSSQLGHLNDTEQANETTAEQNYNTQLRQIGETAADKGFAQSGLRQRDEGQLATDTQNSLNTARRNLSYDASNSAMNFAQKYGSEGIPGLNVAGAPQVTAGQSGFSRGGSTPLYQLSPDVYSGLVGSEQYNQTAAVQNRASQLESAYRSNQGINQARTLQI